MKKILFAIIALSLCVGNVYAQKKKKSTKTVKKEVVEEKEPTPEEILFEELLPSTAKVMFIDSVIVDKADFLKHLPLPTEAGSLTVDGTKVTFTNEFGNKRISAIGDNAKGRSLYIAHRYTDKWEKDDKLSELDTNSQMKDYPFLMSDGVTLYFSAIGDKTLGGRDIYKTTYDADEASFYEATNIGLPFNSSANEYLLAISELDKLGWLVSDRFQPEGKVCIYTFEPSEQRESFDDDIDEETLKSYAVINRIKSTWKFGNAGDAKNRLESLISRINTKQSDDSILFIINDITTYTTLSDFRTTDGTKKYSEIVALKKKHTQLSSLLETTRTNYNPKAQNKHELGRQIVTLEEEVLTLEQTISQKEKQLRNEENNFK